MSLVKRNHEDIRHSLRAPVLAVLMLAALVLLQAPAASAASVRAKGIDVSRWQGTINWKEVAASGVDFAMIGIGRYTNGVRVPDTMFHYNMTNAIANGVDVGVYLYSQAVTAAQARAEAEFVLDQIDGYKISYPVAFDMEYEAQAGLTTKKRTNIVIAFMKVIQEAGYYPVIYASESWFNMYLDMTRLTAYDKWVANWSFQPGIAGMTMWQYSSTGTVGGISTVVDLDYCYVNYPGIITPRTTAVSRTSSPGWHTDGTNYWYVDSGGTILKNQWLTVGKKKYYLNENGYRVTGWGSVGGQYYYFNKNGVMKTGWITVSGKTYYLDPTTGARQKGLITVGSKKYYLNKNGVRKTGWRTISGKTYYFKPSTGAMKKGWLKLCGKTYYLNTNGVRVTGWKQISGKWYYFKKKTGVMLKNVTRSGYIFGSDGVCTNR